VTENFIYICQSFEVHPCNIVVNFCAILCITKENAEEHFHYLIEVLELETQPSVRQLAEWILIRQINSRPNLHFALWQRFNEVCCVVDLKNAIVI